MYLQGLKREVQHILKVRQHLQIIMMDIGWYGQLSSFGVNNTEMYKLFLVYDESLEFTGAPVDVTETPITLSTGWNWIGYTLKSHMI